ncbi:putative HVA22-like protein g [Wolffia australiana]
MLGEFVTWILALLLGYVYPAFQCFRAIEQKNPRMEQLLFWCRYWVIIGLLTALERFGDVFVAWLPLYAEAKLAFIIYLWHPKTEGAVQIYRNFFFPWLSRHEPRINRKLQEARENSGDLILFYLRNFTEKGQSLAFDALQFIVRSIHSEVHRTDSTSPPPPLDDRGSANSRNSGRTAIERILRESPINLIWSGRRRRRRD